MLRHEDAYAKVTREGRWTWGIQLMVPWGDGGRDACVDFDTVTFVGGAKRRARRMLREYVKKHTTPVESFEVHQETKVDKP